MDRHRSWSLFTPPWDSSLDDSFEQELRITFLEEAGEMLANAEQCFLNLEVAKDDPSLIDQIFRLAHSLKGSAKAVGFNAFGDFTHVFESFLLKIQKKEIAVSDSVISLLLECNDFLAHAISSLKGNPMATLEDGELRGRLEDAIAGRMESAPAQVPSDAEFVEDAPVVAFKAEAPKAVPAAGAEKPAAAHDETIRVNLSRIDQLLNSVGELVILQNVMNENRHGVGGALAQKTVVEMGKIIRELQSLSMSLRMLPMKGVFQRMQRIVRDTSKALGKDVELEMVGEETELDKTVIERLSDPLVHLMRNAVDHGVETPEDRLAAGKPPQGRIRLSAVQRANQIVIEIRDDGRGMNPEKLTQKAVEKGVLPAGATLSAEQAYQLIFAPGFSTKEAVTDVSGRGVGMDVVKTNITELQGQIEIESEQGKGSCFRVLLPMTLAIVDAMVIRVGSQKYIIPLAQVTEFFQPDGKSFTSGPMGGEVLNLRGRVMPVFHLGAMLGLKPSTESKETVLTVAGTQGGDFAVCVDEVISQQQVVIKPLGKEVNGLPGIVGASILGDGKAAFILDLCELAKRHRMQKTTKTQMRMLKQEVA
ncbi:MAG: chemotaxis protein CheA [Bdellovibrionaceae bacterium]|nr:chemotaxis protein CheA [Pseudobdellovibrionaceae bacterium]